MSVNAVRERIAASPMGMVQFVAVAICCLANVADGFDVVSMGFAAPLIAKEWGVRPQVLGAVFSAASFGMVAGAFLLAPLADRIGRRRLVLIGLGSMTVVMIGASLVRSIPVLIALRFATGVALAALIASLNVTVVEFANRKWSAVLLSILHIGFAVGVMISGALAAAMIDTFGWRGIFTAAALLNGAIVLAALALLPESLDFLLTRQPKDALQRANKVLARIGQPTLDQLPEKPVRQRGGGANLLFGAGLLWPTLAIWLAFFVYYVVSYFQLNWTPSILDDAGLSTQLALLSGVSTGVGSITGNLSMGFLSARWSVARLTAIYFVLAAASLFAFGVSTAHPALLLTVAAVIGFFIQGAFTGIMILSSRLYPAAIRNTGVGFAFGVGRVGAIFGPILGGQLIGMNLERPEYYPVFAAIAVVGGVGALFSMARRPTDPATVVA